MKTRSLLSRLILLCSLVMVCNSLIIASVIGWQDKPAKITVPEAEAKAVKAMEAAADVPAKFVAAEAFVKKYPASKARSQVVQYMANQVLTLTDPNQKLAMGQKYIALFPESTEAKLVQAVLVDVYVQLKRFDEAFDAGASYLANDPEDIQLRVLLAFSGAELARNQNVKHIKVSGEYGAKAIELIETDKKPTVMDNDTWVKEKALLPTLYQQMAILALVDQKASDAQLKLEKAVKLNPADPFNHAMLGSIANSEYQTLAMSVRGMPDSKSKEDLLKKANQILDQVIEHYARAAALAEGKPQYQPLRDQVMLDLATYYKYRHNSSIDGLQKYIDGYKVP
jgi:tetratricopeptide (TPR) repeat protein